MGRKRKQKILMNVQFTGIADKGKVVGRDEDGIVTFVEGPIPGDVADVLVFRKRKGVFQGQTIAYHHFSEDRVAPKCSHFALCGGCKWQHMKYEAQLHHKQVVVKNALQRIAKVDTAVMEPILGCEEIYYYRNKLEFSFSTKRWLTAAELNAQVTNKENVLGFHKAGAFDKLIDIQHCFLQGGLSNELRNRIKEIALEQGLTFYDNRAHTGFLRQMVVRTSDLGETMLIMGFGYDDASLRKKLLDAILESFPTLTTLVYAINTKLNDYLFDLEMVTYFGKGFVFEQLGHLKYKVGPKSFFQTNARQGNELYKITKEYAGLTGGENVYDLYTGTGSIALFVAEGAKQVVGIEEIEPAIVDAMENAKNNNIDNVIFYAGDVKDVLTEEFAKKHGKPDVLITDPPRAGMHPKVVAFLLELKAPKIVYVSCNPATQARDLALLGEVYELKRSRAVDMFPHTHHIENVVLLELKG